jgi:hypothetical protein
VARPRKTSDKQSTGTPDRTDEKDAIEDAVVIGETDAPQAENRETAVEETAPETSAEIGLSGEVHEERSEVSELEPESVADRSDPPHEPVEEPAPEPETVVEDARPAGPPPPPPARSGGSIALPLIFGGVIAALAGFAASRFILPDGWSGQGETQAALIELRSVTEAQTARVGELESALAALRAEVAAVPDTTPAVAALREDLGGQVAEAAAAASEATGRLGDLDRQLGEVASRLDELAMRPMPGGLDPASLDSELSEFRGELSAAVEAARAEIVRAQEEAAAIAARAAEDAAAQEAAAAEEAEATRAAAEAAARAAARDAAVSRILAALESGEPYDRDVATLEGVEIPEALSAPAANGVPTLAALAETFPEAARSALDASIRANAGEDPVDRLTAFLRVQTGARSLEPREGDDPDAVLSRAEAAVRSGDLDAALTELSALPDAGQAEMGGWIPSARIRLDALSAAQSLLQD